MFAAVLSTDLFTQKETVRPPGEFIPYPPDAAASIGEMVHDWVFWHPLFHDADLSELRLLSKVESGPRRLSEEAIDWARHSWWITRFLGMDRDLPETLALAVRATRIRLPPPGPSRRCVGGGVAGAASNVSKDGMGGAYTLVVQRRRALTWLG